jgi:hypothetical protein
VVDNSWISSANPDATLIVANDWLGNAGETIGQHRKRFNSLPLMQANIDSYRIVAFSVQIESVGAALYESGYMAACSTIGNVNMNQIPSFPAGSFSFYTNQTVDDGQYSHGCKSNQGLRHCVFPRDNSVEIFTPNGLSSGSVNPIALAFPNIQVYGSNMQQSTACIRVTVTRVLEFIPIIQAREIIHTESALNPEPGVAIIGRKIAENPSLVGSTMKEAPKLRATISEKKPNWWQRFKNFLGPVVAPIWKGVKETVTSGVKNMMSGEGGENPLLAGLKLFQQ